MFNTPEDFDAFEDAAAAKLRAEASNIRSKAALRRCAGVGLILCGLAVVIVAGCIGYAKTQEPETKAAKAFMAAMKEPVKIEITTHGEVTARGEVILAKGGMVGVSPDSTVRAVMADTPRPSAEQLQAEAKPASGAPVVTDFVIFHTAPYGVGEVQAGWQFADSNAKAPSNQWCLYTETVNGIGHDVRLGLNGHRADLPSPSPFPSVDLQAAFLSCVWWQESRTPAAATAPADSQAAPPPPHVITARAKS